MSGSTSAYIRYFESPGHWGRSYGTVSEGERARVDALVELLPADARPVLDVGCGDGLVTNRLAELGVEVMGVDLAEEALRHVRAPTMQASSAELPIPDGAVDCVLAANVLEHLPSGQLEGTISELDRVSRRYVLLSMPHREELALAQTRCGRCYTVFHASWHVRSIDLPDVRSWFPRHDVAAARLTGDPLAFRSRRVQRAAQLLGDCWYRPANAVCPTCGYVVDPPRPRPLVRAANGALQRALGIVHRPRPSQLVVLLTRRDDG